MPGAYYAESCCCAVGQTNCCIEVSPGVFACQGPMTPDDCFDIGGNPTGAPCSPDPCLTFQGPCPTNCISCPQTYSATFTTCSRCATSENNTGGFCPDQIFGYSGGYTACPTFPGSCHYARNACSPIPDCSDGGGIFCNVTAQGLSWFATLFKNIPSNQTCGLCNPEICHDFGYPILYLTGISANCNKHNFPASYDGLCPATGLYTASARKPATHGGCLPTGSIS